MFCLNRREDFIWGFLLRNLFWGKPGLMAKLSKFEDFSEMPTNHWKKHQQEIHSIFNNYFWIKVWNITSHQNWKPLRGYRIKAILRFFEPARGLWNCNNKETNMKVFNWISSIPYRNKTHCMPTFRCIHLLSGVSPLFRRDTLE